MENSIRPPTVTRTCVRQRHWSRTLSAETRQRVAVGSPTAEVVSHQRAVVVGSSGSRAHEPSAQLVEAACVAGIAEPVSFHGGECSATEALAVGFNVLRATMRSWGISNPEDLSEWFSRHGFPFVRPGNHLSARAQEHIFAVGCRTDARIAILEALYVLITVNRSRQDIGNRPGPAARGKGKTKFQERCAIDVARQHHEQMDHVNLVDSVFVAHPNVENLPSFLARAIASVSPSPFEKGTQSQSDRGHHIRGTCMEGFRVGPGDVAWQTKRMWFDRQGRVSCKVRQIRTRRLVGALGRGKEQHSR